MKPPFKNAAVFLDRDGTVLNERGYLADPGKMKFYPWAFSALRRLAKAGLKIIFVTNQSGIGRGYFSEDQFKKVNARFLQMLKKKGIRVQAVFYCPHLPGKGCGCRKPGTLLLKRARAKFKINLRRSYVVGDQARDVKMGLKAGAKPVLVLTGGGRTARSSISTRLVKTAKNLETASRWIVQDFLKGS